MLELLTKSGAVIRTDEATPAVNQAAEILGGLVVKSDVEEPRETVLQIMDQNIVGTTLTDSDGTVFTLTHGGWMADSEHISVPPFETIVAATMPGGWAWSL